LLVGDQIGLDYEVNIAVRTQGSRIAEVLYAGPQRDRISPFDRIHNRQVIWEDLQHVAD
jgi:hypothetical protein